MFEDVPVGLVIFGIIAIIVLIVLLKNTVRVVKQSQEYVVERLGKYSRSLGAGLHVLVPVLDKVRAVVDLREQVVSFPPQPVITSDNLVVSIDTVLYFAVTDSRNAVYEIANYIVAIEQLTVTTLRNVIGSMDLEQTLTSRDQINGQLRGVLDEATGKWGIRVNRVELKSIDPPASIQGSMEKQMRAERDRRAAILTAEGVKDSQILTAEGEKQSAILRAEGEAQSAILRAEGEAQAILQVFDAIHAGDADPQLLAYQYLQKLPEIANGNSSKMWIVPAEFTSALNNIAGGFQEAAGGLAPEDIKERRAEARKLREERLAARANLNDPGEALAEARRQAEAASAGAIAAGTHSGVPFDSSVEAGQRPATEAPASPAPTSQPQQPGANPRTWTNPERFGPPA